MLEKIQEDNLSVFLIIDNENHCYVLNNQLIVNREGGWAGHFPFRAFDLLTHLYNNPNARNAIPKRFHHYFESGYKRPDFEILRYLIGEVDEYPSHIVELELAYSSKNPTEVQFTDIYYHNYNPKIYFEPFAVTTQEAFLLYSSILSNDRCYFYKEDIIANYNSFADFPISKESPFLHTTHLELFGEQYMQIARFGIDYLFYLQECLLD